jgi:D-glycero-D-manno-heptose 1,7-bisphosphate phosphatase
MNKAVFLDRDGVINIDDGYVFKIEEFRFMDGIFEFCQTAQEKGYLLIVVTNQGGVERGYYTENDLKVLHDWMVDAFAQKGVKISKVYFCPHYDSYDRKPNPGMLLQAKEEFGIDLSQSILIGDKSSDILAGKNAGIKKLFFLQGRYEYQGEDKVTRVINLKEVEQYF